MRKTLRDSSVSGEVVSLFKPVVGIPFLLVLIAFADWYPEPLKTMFSEPWLDFHAFGYAGLAGSLAALLWIFLYRALKIAESAYVSMLGMATPVLVALFAVLFLNERLSVAQMIGGVLILASGIVAHLTARAKSL